MTVSRLKYSFSPLHEDVKRDPRRAYLPHDGGRKEF